MSKGSYVVVIGTEFFRIEDILLLVHLSQSYIASFCLQKNFVFIIFGIFQSVAIATPYLYAPGVYPL